MCHQGAAHDQHLELTTAAVAGKPPAPLQKSRKVMVYFVKIRSVGFPPSGSRSDPKIFLYRQILERLTPFQYLYDSIPGDRFRRLILELLSLIKDCSICDLAVFRLQES